MGNTDRNQPTTKLRGVCVCVFLGLYSQISNISYTLVGNKIVDHSDVVGASPVNTAPTTSFPP